MPRPSALAGLIPAVTPEEVDAAAPVPEEKPASAPASKPASKAPAKPRVRRAKPKAQEPEPQPEPPAEPEVDLTVPRVRVRPRYVEQLNTRVTVEMREAINKHVAETGEPLVDLADRAFRLAIGMK